MTFRGDLLKLKYLDASAECVIKYNTHMTYISMSSACKTISKWNLCLYELMGCSEKNCKQGASSCKMNRKKNNKNNCFVSLG